MSVPQSAVTPEERLARDERAAADRRMSQREPPEPVDWGQAWPEEWSQPAVSPDYVRSLVMAQWRSAAIEDPNLLLDCADRPVTPEDRL